MIRGLIEKELRQHGFALLFVLLLSVAGAAMIMQNRFIALSFGTPFAAARYFLLTFFPLACLVLSQALIVQEYRQKTQLFLEGLPLPRWKMIAIKYGFGLMLSSIALAVALAAACLHRHALDALTPRFVALVALRSAVYGWFLWSLIFAHGFMGRYRMGFAILGFCVIRLSLVIHHLDLATIGPFELIGERFAYERYVVPAVPLAVTALYALFWTAVGFMLGSARDATIAAALSKRMSSREKMALTFALFAIMLILGRRAQEAERPPAIHLPGAAEVVRGAAHVAAAAAVEAASRAEDALLKEAAERAAAELSRIADYLRIETLPPVFIVHRRDLAGGEMENAQIKQEQGLMVRVNVTAKEYNLDALLRWIIRETLATRSLGRLEREQSAWVLDGFAGWWLTRADGVGQATSETREALDALPEEFSALDVERWLSLRDDAGTESASALAAAGLRVLGAAHGDEARRRFLSSVLAVEVHKDARAWLFDVCHPIPGRLQAAAGVSLAAFAVEWRDALHHAEATRPKENAP
jgi:hypothetical protein